MNLKHIAFFVQARAQGYTGVTGNVQPLKGTNPHGLATVIWSRLRLTGRTSIEPGRSAWVTKDINPAEVFPGGWQWGKNTIALDVVIARLRE